MLQIFVVLFLGLFACEEAPVDPNPSGSKERVFFNGKIYTVNAANGWANAMIVKESLITFVGTDAEAKNRAEEGAEMVDLEESFVMPGIHDVHMHPLEAASENFQFTVNENETDPENFADDVFDAMKAHPGDGWLLGWGHTLETVLDAVRPPKEILDEVAPNRPVAIMEQTSHSLWANSKAIELMGITLTSPDPIGGVVMREENGEANGILFDNAGNMLLDLALQPTANREENDYRGLLDFALPELAKHGITSVCDARTYWKRNQHKTWKRLADEGKLTVRANLGLWAYPAEDDAAQIAMLKSLYANESGSLLKINQIKLYSDGIIHNTTAAMFDDYLIDYIEATTNNGLNYFTESRIANYISELEAVGFDFHIHALGNRGIHESLNAIEQSASTSGRHRLTHVEFLDAADIGRFAQLNVTADAQVAGDFTEPDAWHDNDYLVGSALSENIIPLKSLRDANARITLSSDWDVSTLNPFVGIQHAVTRDPQALSLIDAIKAYTIHAAYVMRQENVVGSLEVGKEADFIILDRNIFDISADRIDQIKVLETYFRGELIYEK